MPIDGLSTSGGPDGLHGKTVAQVQVGRGRHGCGDVLDARRHHPVEMPEPGRAQRLVQGGPVRHPIAESCRHHRCVLAEGIRGVALRPAAPVLQDLGQIPVVQRDEGGDAPLQQVVDQSLVEVQTLGIDGSGTAGNHPGPRDRESIGVDAEGLEQIEIGAPTMVVITGHIPGVTAVDGARHPREGVPDRRRPAVDIMGALDLVRRRSCAPDEVCGKRIRYLHGGVPFRCAGSQVFGHDLVLESSCRACRCRRVVTPAPGCRAQRLLNSRHTRTTPGWSAWWG